MAARTWGFLGLLGARKSPSSDGWGGEERRDGDRDRDRERGGTGAGGLGDVGVGQAVGGVGQRYDGDQ